MDHLDYFALPPLSFISVGTLPNLARLELYTSSHVSPVLDVTYPPVEASEQAQSPLRELRLTHVNSGTASPGDDNNDI
ncbi:hypothetical protein JCM1840_002577 [Sporobolomyces johnsonii]